MDPRLTAGFRALVEHRRREGFDARLGEGCAYLGLRQVAVVARLMQLSGQGGLHAAVLWVGLRVRDGAPAMFFDAVDNYGASPDEAVAAAMLSWLHGVLPPIWPLVGGAMPQSVEVCGRDGHVNIPGWLIYDGPYQASGAEREKLGKALVASPPLMHLSEVLGRKLDPGKLHWLKLYRCKDPVTGFDQADCFLDSVQVQEGVESLLTWGWPPLASRHLFRRFFVLVPDETCKPIPSSPGSADDRPTRSDRHGA
jgi:hypothetical protein